MKRHSARITVIDRRNRTANEADQSRLPLSPEEIEEIRQAYRDGCRGEVIVGMRGEERVIIMLVPETTDAPARDRLPRVREELRRLGCDGMQRTRLSGPA